MAAKTFKMTSEGKAELEKELDYLKTEGRITVTFQKTVNMMKQRVNRLKLKLVSANLNISLIMLKL